MREFYFKLLQGNRRDYVLVIVVGVITVSLIYSTTALTAHLYQIAEGRAGSGTEIYGQLGIFILTYILMVLLLILVVFEYIRKRKYVYGVLNVLGITRKQRSRFIALEYAGIVGVSLIMGFVMGFLIDMIMKKAIIKFLLYGNSAFLSDDRMIPLLLTLIISFLVFIILFLVSDQLIACLGIDAILNPGKGRGLHLTQRKYLLAVALLLEIFAIGSYFGYWGRLYKLFPVVLGGLGLYLIMQFAGERKLEKHRKCKRKYYRNITWTCNWFEHLSYYLNQAYLIAVLVFLILTILGVSFFDYFPAMTGENYPYDIVWMADWEDESFIKKLEENYECEIQARECIRVSTPDYGEHMAISASEYQQWTKQNLELHGEEVFIIYQRERKQRNELGIDYGRKRPRIHIGNAMSDLWIWNTPKIMPSNKFDKNYVIAGERDCILTGVFESSALKKMKSAVWENIIVFSDEYFQEIRTSAQGANLAVMINVSPEDYEMVAAEIKEYAAVHSQRDFFSTEGANLIYEKEKIMTEKQGQNLIQLISVVINGGILLFCGIFVLTMKHKNDTKELCERYQFYEKMGMEDKVRNKNICKESYLFTYIALFAGGMIGIVFAMVEIFRKHMEVQWLLTYMAGTIGIYSGIFILFVIMTGILVLQDISKIERGESR